MSTSLSTGAVRIALLLLVVTASANAQGSPATFRGTGSYAEIRRQCDEYYNPHFEVRTLADVPLSLLITEIKGKRSVGPAAGLDAAGLWFTPLRPKCTGGHTTTSGAAVTDDESADRTFLAPRTGQQLSAVLTLNASYTVFPVDFRVGDNTTPSDDDQIIKEAKLGAYFSAGFGLLYDVRWITRQTKGNRFAIGLIGRAGYFTGTEDAVISVGPLLSISFF
jgi:hypothetical protein